LSNFSSIGKHINVMQRGMHQSIVLETSTCNHTLLCKPTQARERAWKQR